MREPGGDLDDVLLLRRRRRALPLLPTPSSTIVFKGDSLTAGLLLNTSPFPSQFAPNTGYGVVNKGVSGESLATANGNYAAEIGAIYNAGTQNTLVLLQGINDLRGGSNDTTLRATLQTYAGKARTTGYKITIATLLPIAEAGWTGTQEGYRSAYNAWLRANWASFADGLIDFDRISELATPAAPYYQADLLHVSNVGARLLAELVRTRFGLANVNDTIPSAFAFTDVTGATTSTDYTSNAVELAGFTAPAAISVTGGSYSINGGAFTTVSGFVNPYDKVQVKATSSPAAGTAVNAVLTVGGVSDTYTVTTQSAQSDIVTNGDFSGGATGWTGFGFNGKSVSGGQAVFAATTSFDPITQSIAPVAGKYYDLTFTVSGWVGTGQLLPFLDGGTTRLGTVRTANGTYTERLLANTGNNLLKFFNSNSGAAMTCNIDNISLVGPYDTP